MSNKQEKDKQDDIINEFLRLPLESMTPWEIYKKGMKKAVSMMK